MHGTAVSDRFELIEVPRARGAATFGDDVAAGLRATPKRLSSKYLYDRVGSALFDAITHLPQYYLTTAETEILRESGWEIVRVLDEPIDFLELGSGSAIKTRLLIGEALRVQGRLRYSPIDISTDALRTSSLALVEAYPELSVRAYAGDYFDVLASRMLQLQRRTLAMFMGSNIGNYEPPEAARLLALLAAALRPGDGLLLGTDLKKDPATLELAYYDPVGVTAAFNKNLLERINVQLGADFDPRNFTHVVRYDEARGSVDSFLEARRGARVELRSLGLQIEFAAGERIHTESSYKFADDDVATIGAAAGFQLRSTWHDRARRFSVHLLVRA
ncbi:MAG TPA: L-histidine N(alpha)-methyltransferase [Candidatus Tumulicola sp.]|jgi:L-histidine N-alpha-methyltransferase